MTEPEQRKAGIAMLRRMILYVREEALRLRVMDVALLLEHAEDAVADPAPTAVRRRRLAPSPLRADGVEH